MGSCVKIHEMLELGFKFSNGSRPLAVDEGCGKQGFGCD